MIKGFGCFGGLGFVGFSRISQFEVGVFLFFQKFVRAGFDKD